MTRRSIAPVASSIRRADSRLVTSGHGTGHTVTEVVVEESEGDALQGPRRRAHLGEHVDAVLVVLDHPLETADLAFDAP